MGRVLCPANMLLDKSALDCYTDVDSKRRTLDPRLLGKISLINVGQAFFLFI